MTRIIPAAACLLLAAAPAAAQEAPAPIQDNSFLIEEAFNQEPGVVQHVSTYARDGADWAYTFTQEWPLFSQRHQLSFTVPVQNAGPGGSAGIGDVALTYRHQVTSADGQRAVAPRLSLLLPTGDDARGMGAGGAGVQGNLPVSVQLGPRFITHANAGVTWTPAARAADGSRAATTGWNLGQSVIWLARSDVNLLLEAAWSRAEEVVGTDATERADALYLSPGVRWAHNLAGGVQVVPGVAVPIGVGPSAGERSLFLYLSVEHSFARGGR